jgi:group II intron reverse transcriptase/maturase
MVTLTDIVNERNLMTACGRVMQNDGAPGIDGMRAEELFAWLVEHWKQLQSDVLSGSYRPEAVRRVEIPKPNGGMRQLGIPTVIDRMLQQSIAQELDKYYDSTFSQTSYGFRRGRSAHDALEQAQQYLNEGYEYIVEIDLEKFFDRVNHDRLMSRLSQRIEDKGTLRLIRRYLTCGVMEHGVKRTVDEGTPQGGPLSPILSNIVLDELDKELENRGLRFVRYADDISIFTRSQRSAERVLTGITQWIETRLKLRVNRDKSGVRRPGNGQLLGFGFWNGRGGEKRVRVSEKSYKRLMDKIRKATNRSRPISMDERIAKLMHITRGWVNYFAVADAITRLQLIEAWTQARLRMCVWKQWKRASARISALQKLGVSPQKAHQWANTRKGYWRTAHSPILNSTITCERLKQKGYIPITEMYAQRRATLMNRRDTRTVRPVV